MLTDEQIAERRFRLGASELSAIFGDNEYCTPFELFARKTGRYAESPSNAAIDLGNRMEPVLIDRIEGKYGVKCVRGEEVRVAKSLPIVATLDARFEDWSRVVECKAVNIVHTDYQVIKDWTDSTYPRAHWWQLQTQMIAAEIPDGILTALVGGKGFQDYEVPVDFEKMSDAIRQAVDWWDRHIVLDSPPDPTPLDLDVLQKIPPVKGLVADLDDSLIDVAGELEEVRAAKSRSEKREKELKGLIAAAIGLAEAGRLPNGWEIRYAMQERKGFEVKPTKFRTIEVKR